MILIVTNRRDLTCDFIVLELQRRGLEFVRLNTETLARGHVRVGGASGAWSVNVDGREISAEQIRAAYFRRPGAPEPDPAVTAPGHRDYCLAEWRALLKSFYTRLDGLWLNSPWAILRAEDKPHQLLCAARLGFEVPETLITNDVAEAQAFAATGSVIVKPLRQALIEADEDQVVFTSRWSDPAAGDAQAWAAAPLIVQHEVPKRADLRVTVVDDQVFAVAIDSQTTTETQVDWRRGADPSLKHERVALPEGMAERCRALTRKLDLRFGAIDLVHRTDGGYSFLEINPNGQWAWIEQRTGVPIAAAIVDALARPHP